METDVLCQRHCTHQVKYKYNTPLFELQLPMLSLCGYIQIALSSLLLMFHGIICLYNLEI